VAAPIAAPSDLPILLMGMENWLQVLLFEPELAEAWSTLALDHFEALAAAYFKAGASFLVTPVMMVNPALVDSGMSKRLILPLLREAFARLGGPIVFHHGGNRIAKCIGNLKDLPNVAGFVVDEGDSLSAVRRLPWAGYAAPWQSERPPLFAPQCRGCTEAGRFHTGKQGRGCKVHTGLGWCGYSFDTDPHPGRYTPQVEAFVSRRDGACPVSVMRHIQGRVPIAAGNPPSVPGSRLSGFHAAYGSSENWMGYWTPSCRNTVTTCTHLLR
jgi:hypothetical protein